MDAILTVKKDCLIAREEFKKGTYYFHNGGSPSNPVTLAIRNGGWLKVEDELPDPCDNWRDEKHYVLLKYQKGKQGTFITEGYLKNVKKCVRTSQKEDGTWDTEYVNSGEQEWYDYADRLLCLISPTSKNKVLEWRELEEIE